MTGEFNTIGLRSADLESQGILLTLSSSNDFLIIRAIWGLPLSYWMKSGPEFLRKITATGDTGFVQKKLLIIYIIFKLIFLITFKCNIGKVFLFCIMGSILNYLSVLCSLYQ